MGGHSCLSRSHSEQGCVLYCQILTRHDGSRYVPGVVAQLASWYRTEEMGRPITWFFAIQTAATIVGSLVCYGISYMDGIRGLSAWRW